MFQPGVLGSSDSDPTGTLRICIIGPVQTEMKDASSKEKRESGRSISWGPVENAGDKLNYCVHVDPVAYLNTASRAGRGCRAGAAEPRAGGGREHPPQPRLRESSSGPPGKASAGQGRAGRGLGPGGRGRGSGGGPSPGAVNFSWAAACQPQKALKVQQPAPASAAAFVRVIYDFNLGSPRVHTAFAAVEG